MPTSASSRSTRHKRPSLAGASASENAATATRMLLCTVKKLNMRTNRVATGAVPVRTFSTDCTTRAAITSTPTAPLKIWLARMPEPPRTEATTRGLSGARSGPLALAAARPRPEPAPLKEAAGALAAEEAAVADQHIAALQHDLGDAEDGPALVAAVVDVHVVGRRGQRPARCRVEDDDVGVSAGREGALARVQPEHPGRRRGGQLDEPHRADPAAFDAAVPEQRVPVFDGGQPVRDGGEVVLAEDLLVLVVERAVVGGDQLEIIGDQAVPEVGLMVGGPERRRADELGALEARPGQVVERQVQVLRAGLRVDRGAVVAAFADRVERVP